MMQTTDKADSNRPFPNLYLAGAPKCGTTSLAAWLGQHPDIFAPIVKEPVIFATDLTQERRPSPEQVFLTHFAGWAEQRYALDASTHYFYSPAAPAEIKEASPDARVFVLVRNPAEAVHSMFHQMQFNGSEKLPSLEQSLEAMDSRKRDLQPIRNGYPESLIYKDVFGYSANISNFLNSFDPRNFHVLLFDDLKNDPEAMVRSIFNRLGLDEEPAAEIDYSPKNSAKQARWSSLNTLATYPPEWIGTFSKRLLSYERRQKLRAFIRKKNTKQVDNPPLEPDTRQQLNALFRAEIEWLEDYLQRDLGHWTRQ